MTARPNLWNPYFIATLAILAAFGVQSALGPHFGSAFTFVPFYFAVMLAAWLGGLNPALFAMALGYGLASYYFISPGSLVIQGRGNLAGLAVYLILSLSMGLLTESLHKVRWHVEEARERLRVTLASIGEAVVATDAAGRITAFNAAAERLTGWQALDALGRDLEAVFRTVNPKSGTIIAKTARRILQGSVMAELEKHVLLISKDGESLAVEESASPIRDEAGATTGLVVIFRDVTAKRRAEEHIRRLAMDAPVGIFQTDPQGNCVFVNERWCEITGLSREAALESGWSATVHPADRKSVFKDWKKNLSAGASFDGEYRFVTPQGHVHWVSGSAVPLWDENGEVTSYLGAIADITDRVKGEKALFESQQQFRAMFELAGIGMVQADISSGKYLRVNPKFCEITGYTRDELLQMTSTHLTHPEDKHRNIKLLDRVLSSEISEWSSEQRYLRKDGTTIWVHVSGTVIFDADKQPIRTVAHIQDITERKLSEENLRSSEKRFRTMADSAPVMIWMCTAEKARSWFNKPWLEFTGKTMDDALGFGWTDGIHPEDRECCSQLFGAAFDARRNVRMEYRLRRHDGQYRWVLDQATPLYRAGGNFDGYIGSAIDIHEKTEVEETLKEADRRKNEFLAMLAHELRNPLATIQYANYVSAIPDGDTDETDYPKLIDDQVKHLARLIDDLLDVSRITQEKIELKARFLDASTVIQQAVAATGALIENRGHQLLLNISPEPMPLVADPTRLEQVVQNLLNNAAKYTPPGGCIEVTARPQGTEIILSVKDNGVGMSAELIPKVFELFTQGDRTLDRSEGGLGIGLTLVRKLVGLHGGTVIARSEGLGHGSEFIVRLPLAPEASPAADVGPAQPPGVRRRLRILVVEDNIHSAKGLTLLLKNEGHSVEMCHHGAEAVRAALQQDPDVVLLDIGLPGMDGYQVARELRQDDHLKHVAIIALSGYGQDRDREMSRDAGFDWHLVKPIDYGLLQTLLSRVEPTRPAPISS